MALDLIILGGLAAGMVHVLSGPDHLAAIAPLAADSSRTHWKTGFSWGVGHTSGVLVVGVLALLLKEVLPLEAISSWSERLVGVALVAVGAWGAHRAMATRVHIHEHTHGGASHAHVHVHATGRQHDAPRPHAHAHTHTSFGFGILHGLAGSSHVLGILPALALPTRAASAAYLAAYGVGNIAAMTVFAAIMGALAVRAELAGRRLYQGLLTACSVAAIVVGAFWLLA